MAGDSCWAVWVNEGPSWEPLSKDHCILGSMLGLLYMSYSQNHG